MREFDAKWVRYGRPADKRLVGSADIQSLAAMSESFGIVQSMRAVPLTNETLIQLAIATVSPIAPPLLTMMTVEDLFEKAPRHIALGNCHTNSSNKSTCTSSSGPPKTWVLFVLSPQWRRYIYSLWPSRQQLNV